LGEIRYLLYQKKVFGMIRPNTKFHGVAPQRTPRGKLSADEKKVFARRFHRLKE
jgi:hypothetical protein